VCKNTASGTRAMMFLHILWLNLSSKLTF